MTEVHHDKPKAHQTRIPLHERGINIDELTFDMDPIDGRTVRCTTRPDISLNLVLQYDRHTESEILVLQIDDQRIRVDPLPSGTEQEAIAVKDATENDIVWVINSIGTAIPSNQAFTAPVETFRFCDEEEQTFTIKLLMKIFLRHDRMLAFYAKKLGQPITENFGIMVGLSADLQRKIANGELVNG